MLPTLKKSTPQQFQASQIKLYHPPRQLMNLDTQNQRRTSFVSSSRAHSKIRVKAGGNKKDQSSYENVKSGFTMKNSLPQQNYATLNNQPQFLNKSVAFAKLNSNKDLSAEIKLIEKKIRYHKKKLQQQKKKKEQEQKAKNDPYSQQFESIIKKEMQLQGYTYHNQQNQNKGFDYLTNPGKLHNQQPQQQPQVIPPQPQPLFIQPKKYDLAQKVQKLQKHYENNLKKKFERREMFPHYPCKRKTPKLYVTAKTNALEKYGKRPAQQQHMFRVLTKQCTPQQIYPTIPNFAIVKDNLSKNVLAYLTDFKPFIDKTKQDVFEDQQKNHSARQNRQQKDQTGKKNQQEGVIYKDDRRSSAQQLRA